MGLFGGSSSKKQLKSMMKSLEKTKRRIYLRCPRCGEVRFTDVYGDGSFSGQCRCGYHLTERDRY